MSEVYVLVERKKPVIIKFFGIFSYVIGVLSVIATIIVGSIFPITAILGILLGYFFQTRNYEIEYAYFDGDVRFAKIINKAKRKRLPGYKMADVYMIAPAGDPSVYNYENEHGATIRRYQSGYKQEKLYVMAVKGKDSTELIYFEPDEKYLDAVCQKFGHKVRR